jgi:type II secretory pathway component PulJ
MSLIEMVFALAIFSLLGLGTWRGLDSLQSAARIEAARMDFIVALSAARRRPMPRAEPCSPPPAPAIAR